MTTTYLLRAGTSYWSPSGWTTHRASAERYGSLAGACGARADLSSDRDVVVVRVVGEPGEREEAAT